jgi:hypothetical protein
LPDVYLPYKRYIIGLYIDEAGLCIRVIVDDIIAVIFIFNRCTDDGYSSVKSVFSALQGLITFTVSLLDRAPSLKSLLIVNES